MTETIRKTVLCKICGGLGTLWSYSGRWSSNHGFNCPYDDQPWHIEAVQVWRRREQARRICNKHFDRKNAWNTGERVRIRATIMYLTISQGLENLSTDVRKIAQTIIVDEEQIAEDHWNFGEETRENAQLTAEAMRRGLPGFDVQVEDVKQLAHTAREELEATRAAEKLERERVAFEQKRARKLALKERLEAELAKMDREQLIARVLKLRGLLHIKTWEQERSSRS